MKLPLLVGWTHPFAPLGTPLVDRDAMAEVVAAFLAHIAGDAALPKLMLLPLLPRCRAGCAGAAERERKAGGAACAFGAHRRAALDLAAGRPRDLDEVIGAKRMREARRLRRRLGEAGRVEFAVARYPRTTSRRRCSDSSRWNCRAGKARPAPRSIQSAAHRGFAEAALDALARRGEATVAELSLDGRGGRERHPVAQRRSRVVMEDGL